MSIRVLTVDREFGCGGSEVAEALAQRLQWKLWDQALTAEIAKRTKSDPAVVAKREWQKDSTIYRMFKTFLRGAFEGSLPPVKQLELLDSETIARVTQSIVQDVATEGRCVLVGRGSAYFLRERCDTIHCFLYASTEFKVQHLIRSGEKPSEALRLVDSTDSDRAAFVKHYFHLKWPDRQDYHLMLNTSLGIGPVVNSILHYVQDVDALRR